MKPHFHFVALFPEIVDVWLKSSILGRALKNGIFEYSLYQLRDFSVDRHRSVDDVAYGGGGGMVLRVEPLVSAVESIQARFPSEKVTVIYFSPAGEPINPKVLESFKGENKSRHLVLICGHYEGVDQRFLDHWVDREISLGDFVVTGGEIPALAFSDAFIRLLDGSLSHEDANQIESFSIKGPDGGYLLEYSQYTRPSAFRNLNVPDILLSGNHDLVRRWRTENALSRTVARRPDLIPPQKS
jgi:tRNA (guanine37-N1)-methyltransferase